MRYLSDVGEPRGTSLGDRLAAQRAQLFVGRARELALAEDLVTGAFDVLHVHGPGGVGKTTLLLEIARRAEARGLRVARLDARHLGVDAHEVGAALAAAVGGGPPGMLVIDTFERLRALEAWLRDEFLPSLPASTRVVIAGRYPPTDEWRTDLGWIDRLRVVSLRHLDDGDAREYLRRRGVPDAAHEEALRVTLGHPLALSLVAEPLRAGADAPAGAMDAALRGLLERFRSEAPTPRHQRALEVAAILRVTTEPALRGVLGADDAAELFAWLRGLSFVEAAPQGLVLHDLVRDTVAAELCWRDPDGHRQLLGRARDFYRGRVLGLERTERAAQLALLYDMTYLHRTNPVVRHLFAFDQDFAHYEDRVRDSDWPAIEAALRRHESEDAIRWARHWAVAQADAASVFRGADGRPVGFHLALRLDLAGRAAGLDDPAVAAAWAHVDAAVGLRDEECALLTRFWLDLERYQAVTDVGSQMFLHMVRRYAVTPGLAYAYATFADAVFWTPAFLYMRFERLTAVDFEVGGRRFGVFGHDWRGEPVTSWLDWVGNQVLAVTHAGALARPARTDVAVALSRHEFLAATRAALRDRHSVERLAENPLASSRLVRVGLDARAGGDARTRHLATLLDRAHAELAADARTEKSMRAVHRAYLDPAETHELAADALGISYSTFRRWLQRGTEEIASWLWRLEVDDDQRDEPWPFDDS